MSTSHSPRAAAAAEAPTLLQSMEAERDEAMRILRHVVQGRKTDVETATSSSAVAEFIKNHHPARSGCSFFFLKPETTP